MEIAYEAIRFNVGKELRDFFEKGRKDLRGMLPVKTVKSASMP